MFPHPRFGRRVRWSCTLVVLGSVAACAESPSKSARARDTAAAAAAGVVAPAETDDFGAPVPRDASAAARVVSLNPAATEIIYAIGAESRLVGRSRWDAFPAAATTLPALGDGIRPNVEAVLAVRPTLVVLYATADNRPAAEAFARAGVRTLAVRVDRIAQFHALVRTLGVALGEPTRAAAVNDSVTATLERVQRTMRRLVPDSARPAVLWPVWLSPPMVIGGGSYLDELLSIAGGRNVFHDQPGPSPTVSLEDIIARQPTIVVTSETRARDLRTSPTWGKLPAVQRGAFAFDDPALAGRPSVVLGMAAVQLARALHPQLADSIR